MAAAKRERAAGNHAADELARHVPKLLLRRHALEYTVFTYFGGMVQHALHRLGMTPAGVRGEASRGRVPCGWGEAEPEPVMG